MAARRAVAAVFAVGVLGCVGTNTGSQFPAPMISSSFASDSGAVSARTSQSNLRKLLVSPRSGSGKPAAAVLTAHGARTIAEYDAASAIAVPDEAFDRLGAALARDFELEELSDVVYTPRGRINTADRVLQSAPYGEGLLLVQFAAPPRPEWTAAIKTAGLRTIDYLPERAVIVAGRTAAIDALTHLPWVQFAGPYLPAYKAAAVAPPAHTDFLVQLAIGRDSDAQLESLRARFGPFGFEVRQANDVVVRITTDLASANALLDGPHVVAVEAYWPPTPSDERQALSVTGIPNLAGSPTRYLTWLSARGIDPAGLTNDPWGRSIVVDIADTGVDQGCCSHYSYAHPDLKGRVVYHQATTAPGECNGKDLQLHGTVVATMAGGLPTSGVDTAGTATQGFEYTDAGGYFYGMGVAPGVRLGNTRIVGIDNVVHGSVGDWTRLAVTARCNVPAEPCAPYEACPATVQNHSQNQYDDFGTNAGVYTQNSRLFDFAVRDANNTDDAGGVINTPLAVTMSAGNYRQYPIDTSFKVMAAATAKNVISMGSVETHRTPSLWPGQTTETTAPAACTTTPENTERHRADGFGVVAYSSRRGTDDFRLKPDFLAPATLAFGASPVYSQAGFCAKADAVSNPKYQGTAGTSFAAPVAAGAIALLRYYYHRNFGLIPSPAMYKAMLAAGGRSVTGGLDRLDTVRLGQTTTVGKWPSNPQGFGVIDLSDLLTSNATRMKSWRDQQAILLAGQAHSFVVTVADPSKPVRIAIAWTDAPAAARMPGDMNKVLVNDLHLRVTSPFAAYGNSTDANGYSYINPGCGRSVCSFADGRNNVEVINLHPQLFTDPANRTFTISVATGGLFGEGVPGAAGGSANQDYALFVLNGSIQ